MPRYPYLLFDADDTIFDFARNGKRAFTMLCAKYQLPCTEESREIYENFNQPLWHELERGSITKEFLKVERFRRFLEYYHRSEDVEALTNDLVYTARSMIMALPGRLAMDVVQAGSANEASALIRTECYKILDELAGYQYDPEAYRRRVRDREGWSDALADEEADE